MMGEKHLLTWVLKSLECRRLCPFLLLHLELQVSTGKFANWLFSLAPGRLRAKLAEARSMRSNGLFYNPALFLLSSYSLFQLVHCLLFVYKPTQVILEIYWCWISRYNSLFTVCPNNGIFQLLPQILSEIIPYNRSQLTHSSQLHLTQ